MSEEPRCGEHVHFNGAFHRCVFVHRHRGFHGANTSGIGLATIWPNQHQGDRPRLTPPGYAAYLQAEGEELERLNAAAAVKTLRLKLVTEEKKELAKERAREASRIRYEEGRLDLEHEKSERKRIAADDKRRCHRNYSAIFAPVDEATIHMASTGVRTREPLPGADEMWDMPPPFLDEEPMDLRDHEDWLRWERRRQRYREGSLGS